MKIVILQPRISYYSGGGELMPMELIKALSEDTQYSENRIESLKLWWTCV